MTTVASKIEIISNELKAQREELSDQLNLNGEGVKSQWFEVEEKWREFEEKYERLMHSVGKATINLGRDLEQLSGELKQHYQQIQAQLN